MNQSTDPAALGLEQLRAVRKEMQDRENVVSFVRRLAQGRIDLVAAVREQRVSGDAQVTAADIIRRGVGPAPSTGSARPPRDTEVADDNPLLVEFDRLCDSLGFDNMSELDGPGLDQLHAGLVSFEAEQSTVRRQLFDSIDALTAELVKRYRSGDASVDSLLGD